MKCKQCNNVITGKAVYCSPRCRKAASRSVTPPTPNPPATVTNCDTVSVTSGGNCDNITVTSVSEPTVTIPVTSPAQVFSVTKAATRTNPDALNYDKPMSLHQLDKARLKANRVPIPGDADYNGVCEQVDGKWQVKA